MASMTTGTRFGWMEFRECGELLCRNRFPLRLKRAVYKGM